jgi:hypothetical protein
MTIPNDEAKFSVEWSNIQNFVARVGLKFDETKKHQEIGTFTADYAFQSSAIQGNGLAYYGIYGWTTDTVRVINDSTVEYSLVEFYIMEDWKNWNPRTGAQSNDGNHFIKGKVTADGGEYDVVTRNMSNQPSIKGTASFPQVFSIRKSPRSNGSISISEHFKAWEKMGIKLGNMYEVKIKVESYSGSSASSGSCNVTKGVIKINGNIPTQIVQKRDPVLHKRYSMPSGNYTAPGVYTLVSLTGEKVKSMTITPSKPATFSTKGVVHGIYFLHFKGNGLSPITRSIVVK